MNMDLSFNSKMEAYYQKFFELQEKLRTSEEERLKLEMRFNELVQISKEEEQAHYKKLRSQYKKFLEEDRKRQERNEKIVRTLERIESRVNMLTSKTDRVKMLRRQYQNYLQRVSQSPIAKQQYIPAKIAEELPSDERKISFDYDKKSSDIAMLKKAYGKTNDEKIEILDKYLQNLKAQKGHTLPENKLSENKTDINELQYFDEVSKKLNDGFNSNKANSIAEDIMNSIYARHYKTDLFKDDAKTVSKFTSPGHTNRYPDKEKYSGFGDQRSDMRNTSSINSYGSASYKDMDTVLRNDGKNKLNQNPYTLSITIAKDLQGFEEDAIRQTDLGKTYESALKNRADLSLSNSDQFKVLPKGISEKIYGKDDDMTRFSGNSPKKTEIDLNENEKQVPTTEENFVRESEGYSVDKEYNPNRVTFAKKTGLTNVEPSNKNTIDSNEIVNEVRETENRDINPEDQSNVLSNNEDYQPEANQEPNEDIPNIDAGSVESEAEVDEKYEHEENEATQQHENKSDIHGNDEDLTDKHDEYGNQTVYDETDQQLQAQYENNDQVYDENAEMFDQYDSNEQPIEQLYGENAKALLQYEENGQTIYDQRYNENGQSDQHIFEGNDEDIPQYDSNVQENSKKYDENNDPTQQCHQNDQPIQQCDENGELNQLYDENGQPSQQYDVDGESTQQYIENDQVIQQYEENDHPIQQDNENVQSIPQYNENDQLIQQQYNENDLPVQQYDENGQPLQQYNENGQLIQQYDENGQLILQYDENGQPIQRYDENGQLTQQFDENGQPVQQYDENGQPFQQYDENGQPLYFNQGEFVQYDENGQIIQQYDENGGQIIQQCDENGQPIAPGYDESYQHYDASGQPIAEYEGQLVNEVAKNDQSLQQYDVNQYNTQQQAQNIQGDVEKENVSKKEEHIDQALKKKNVLDLLDTDSESIKQNISKISNDSDFDFSNG